MKPCLLYFCKGFSKEPCEWHHEYTSHMESFWYWRVVGQRQGGWELTSERGRDKACSLSEDFAPFSVLCWLWAGESMKRISICLWLLLSLLFQIRYFKTSQCLWCSTCRLILQKPFRKIRIKGIFVRETAYVVRAPSNSRSLCFHLPTWDLRTTLGCSGWPSAQRISHIIPWEASTHELRCIALIRLPTVPCRRDGGIYQSLNRGHTSPWISFKSGTSSNHSW